MSACPNLALDLTHEAPTILLVDDDPRSIKLARIHLEAAGFGVVTAESAAAALAEARQSPPTAIMSDVLMSGVDGFELCRRVRAEPSLAAVPIILISGHYEGIAAQQLATSCGAAALIQRTPEFEAELGTLATTLVGASQTLAAAAARVVTPPATGRHNQIVARAERAEVRYRTLFENAHDTITLLTPEGIILDANERWRDILGVAPQQMIGHHISKYAAPGRESALVLDYRRTVASGGGRHAEVPIRHADGRTIYMEFSVSTVALEGSPTVISIGRDVTEQVLAAQRLRAAEERYRSLLDRIPDVIWKIDGRGSLLFITPNAETLLGFTPAELGTQDFAARTARVHLDHRQSVRDGLEDLVVRGKPFDMEYREQRKDGTWIWVRNRATATYQENGVDFIEGMMTDVTERRRLEESLRQAQKMEAIGQLTGGIAHDFNNILAAILAHAHFLIEDLPENDPRRSDAEEVKIAAQRAAALTKQLLAFSRHQVLEPTVLDLNATLGNVERMLQRLIGEDVELAVLAGKNLGRVKADNGQIEQVIMNLVVNARDAMPQGGRIVIETSNVELDGEFAAKHVGALPGHYVMLTVSDTGCGMDAETRSHIFEPFFTTKEVGRGTGLGLSTCYGIVKQSGGSIWVYSEPGHGTVFKVFLPRVTDHITESRRRTRLTALRGDETVLLIEDDSGVRAAVKRMLEESGYRVLVARDGSEAIELARQSGTLDVVLSDVVMPKTSGPDVVRALRRMHPEVRALFMSGYTDHAILRSGVLEDGVAFIQKPFAPEALALKLREVVHG